MKSTTSSELNSLKPGGDQDLVVVLIRVRKHLTDRRSGRGGGIGGK